MRNIVVSIVFLTVIFPFFSQKDPVILSVNKEKVKKSEFLQIYLKNNPNPKYDKASLDEYMQLFQKFKLKVVEAQALGYDTIPKLKREFEGYKKQLAIPYLIDSAQNQALVQEAYDRTKMEIRCSHILVKLDPTASPADTLEAYNRIISLKKRIEKGEDFASVARMKNGSDDPSAATNGGDLGYFTAFQMVYPFEDKAYKTPIGSVSDPFRTRFGYHILKTTGSRPSRGSIKTAHIMISIEKNADQATIDNARKKVDEIYAKLQNGAKWEEMVTMYSDDPSTTKKAGELPVFGSGTSQRMIPEFEEAAFSLQKDGDISAPIKTNYGFHVIKRIEKKEVSSFESMKKELQAKVNKDERSKKTQDSFVRKLKERYGYEKGPSSNLQWFVDHLDSTYFIGKWSAKDLKSDKVLFTLDGVSFGQQQFARYLEKNYRALRKDRSDVLVEAQCKNWEKAAILEYEESLLPAKYADYRALVKEYHDGILLYEIMSDKVWNKAVKDTAGLRSYYMENAGNYRWPARISATVYECATQAIAGEVYAMLSNDTITSKHVIEKINKETELNLKVKMNKFDPETTNFLKGRFLAMGRNLPYEFEGKQYVVIVSEQLPPMNKAFSEAKGVATSDYQNFLESTWLTSLKSKYKVKVNKKVLYTLGE
jgi:peptidyl-prolyl cis-trans isomerase SurA